MNVQEFLNQVSTDSPLIEPLQLAIVATGINLSENALEHRRAIERVIDSIHGRAVLAAGMFMPSTEMEADDAWEDIWTKTRWLFGLLEGEKTLSAACEGALYIAIRDDAELQAAGIFDSNPEFQSDQCMSHQEYVVYRFQRVLGWLYNTLIQVNKDSSYDGRFIVRLADNYDAAWDHDGAEHFSFELALKDSCELSGEFTPEQSQLLVSRILPLLLDGRAAIPHFSRDSSSTATEIVFTHERE